MAGLGIPCTYGFQDAHLFGEEGLQLLLIQDTITVDIWGGDNTVSWGTEDKVGQRPEGPAGEGIWADVRSVLEDK